MLMRIFSALIFCIAIVTTSAVASEQPSAAFSGYGSPHSGLCVKSGIEAATACAVDACLKAGATPLQCKTVRTCASAGWSLTVGLAHPGGYRWEEFHCGYKNRADALRMMPFFCRESRLKMVSSCKLTSLIDPDGKTVPLD